VGILLLTKIDHLINKAFFILFFILLPLKLLNGILFLLPLIFEIGGELSMGPNTIPVAVESYTTSNHLTTS